MPSYAEYLKIDSLLALQAPGGAEHDEMLFIIIHQTYELWFKQLLHELVKVRIDLSSGDIYESIATFKRCRTIMKVLVSQLDILETMTPMSFTSFRDRLDTSSGFQSTQFREFEFILGYKRPEVLEYLPKDEPLAERAIRRLEEPSIVDAFYDFLEHHGANVPLELRERDPRAPAIADEAVQDGLFELYTTRNDLAILFELMTDFDEGQQEWRYRHVKLVERTIGAKKGTGGSPGVEFLKRSLFQPVFADLWAIRHRL
jgi:tryptophan 2,3-dioxygenase